jgi:ketosteroid isomerase-like protein
MSEENVEIVTQALHGSGDLEADAVWWHPQVEWVIAREHPEARTLNGRDAVVAYLQDWQTALPGMSFDTKRVVEAGEAVVAVGTVRGTGLGSGADVEVPLALVCVVNHGMVARVEEYLNPDEALEAVVPAE